MPRQPRDVAQDAGLGTREALATVPPQSSHAEPDNDTWPKVIAAETRGFAPNADRFQWKTTIGPLATRPGHPGTWGYRSSDGMGLLEYLEWCEDLGMEPVLGVYAGYSLNGTHVNPGADLQPYVQDALDEIDYLTGDATTVWGARRAADGHPDRFPFEFVEVGNEDFFDGSGSYDARFAQFFDAIKAAHPKLEVIATAPVASRKPDVLDESMFARHAGNVVLPATLTTSGGSQLFHSVTQDSVSGTIFLKLVNAAGAPQPVHISLTGVTAVSSRAKAIVLASGNPQDTNTMTDPTRVVPRTSTLTGIAPTFDHALAP